MDARRSLKYVGKAYFKPGKGWHYSNTNYLLLGLIAERVGKATLASQLESRFFGPLGLDHTFEQIGGSAGRAGRPRLSLRRRRAPSSDRSTSATARRWRRSPRSSPPPAAAGSIASTPKDLVRWARALYSGAVLDPDSSR